MVMLLIVFGLLLAGWYWAWSSQPRFAFGVLLGAGLAWVGVLRFRPYLTGSEQMPVWLPPLPVATIAIVLLVYGILIWFRGDAPPAPKPDTDHHSHY
jgi:drug/metabolite transporter (DMT)-like permease